MVTRRSNVTLTRVICGHSKVKRDHDDCPFGANRQFADDALFTAAVDAHVDHVTRLRAAIGPFGCNPTPRYAVKSCSLSNHTHLLSNLHFHVVVLFARTR